MKSCLCLLVLWILPATAGAQTASPGRNCVAVRGQQQEIYYYPAAGPRLNHRILFASGDGGWRGWAATVAQRMASWGYDVYGLDTKTYLESFTGRATLREGDVMADFRQIAEWMTGGSGERITLVGWSEGAGLTLLAAAGAGNKLAFTGLVTFGLGDANVLGWRWQDNITYVTRQLPHEPIFRAASFMGQVAPLPLVMLQSSQDEYVPLSESQGLFAAARDPKRWVPIQAQNHRFEGNTRQFFSALREGIQWLKASSR